VSSCGDPGEVVLLAILRVAGNPTCLYMPASRLLAGSEFPVLALYFKEASMLAETHCQRDSFLSALEAHEW